MLYTLLNGKLPIQHRYLQNYLRDQWYLCCGLILFIVLFLILYNGEPKQEIVWANASYNPEHDSCIPHYEVMRNHKTAWFVGYPPVDPWNTCVRKFVVMGAYAYETHVSVSMDLPSKCKDKMYCNFFDANMSVLGAPVEAYVFPYYTAHCCKPVGAHYVSITSNWLKEISRKNIVPLIKKNPLNNKVDLGLCLAAIYGDNPTFLLTAELIEHYKMQGVGKFYIYVKEMNDYNLKILEDYQKKGEIELIRTHPEHFDDPTFYQWPSLHDCVHRSRYDSRYLIYHDLDELFIPLVPSKTLQQYTKEKFDANPNLASLRFHRQMVKRDKIHPAVYIGEQTILEGLPALVFRNSSIDKVDTDDEKSIIDPTKVLLMFFHWPELMVPGTVEESVNKNEVIIKHYRDTILSTWNYYAEKLNGTFGDTYYPSVLMEQLIKKVKNKLDAVY